MRKIAGSYPLSVLLIPAFFLLHVLNNYYGLIPATAYVMAGGYYLLLSFLLLGAGRLLLGTWSKAGIWTAVLLIPFYFFGALHDGMKGIGLPAWVTSYTFLLILLTIGAAGLSIYLKRQPGPFRKAHRFLNLLFGILVLVETTQLTYAIATGREKENDYTASQPPVLTALPTPNGPAPDIFFIIFDEYTSSLALQQYFQYDNHLADSVLRANHFFVAARSQSNYNSTPLSIGSSLNLQYFNRPLENDVATTKKILQALHTLRKSRLPQWLAKKQYDVYNYGLCDFDNYPVHTSRTFEDYETLPLYQETLWGRIERDIWWHMYKINLPVLPGLRSRQIAREARKVIHRNEANFQSTLAALRQQSEKPKFVFAHFMLPHAPFFLDEKGQPNPPALAGDKYNPALYLKQLAYSNQWIDSLARAANHSWPRPRVVIIAGDHGFRDKSMAIRDKQFMNLNACYFSGGAPALYDSISPINSFRVVCNQYFGTRLPLLKDSTILLR